MKIDRVVSTAQSQEVCATVIEPRGLSSRAPKEKIPRRRWHSVCSLNQEGFVRHGERAEHSSRRELLCTGVEIRLNVAWAWFRIAGSEDGYREGQNSAFTG